MAQSGPGLQGRPPALRTAAALVPELLEALKAEYDGLLRDVATLRVERDEAERKNQLFLADAQQLQSHVFALERALETMRNHYEEELRRLRGETQAAPPVAPTPALTQSPPAPTLPPSAAPLPTSLPATSQQSPLPTPSPLLAATSAPRLPTPAPAPAPASAPASAPAPSPTPAPTSSPTPTPASTSASAPAPAATPPVRHHLSGALLGPGPEWFVGYNPHVPRRLNVKIEHTFELSHSVTALRFSSGGRYLASASLRHSILWDPVTGARLHLLPESGPVQGPEEAAYVRALAFSPEGSTLATGGAQAHIQLWNTETGAPGQTLTGHTGDLYALDWHNDLLVSGSADRTVRLWRPESETPFVRQWTGYQDAVTAVAFSPDGQVVAAASLDKTIRLWSVEGGELIGKCEGHEEAVYALAFSPDGRLASGSMDRSIRLWDIRSLSTPPQVLMGHKDYILALAYTPEGDWLISGSKDRSLQVWDARVGVAHMILQGHRNSVLTVATAPKGTSGGRFASGSGDNKACLWEYQTCSGKIGSHAPI